MKNKVVRQLNVLTTGDDGTGEEWEVLTKDMGCLMEDTESEGGYASDYVNSNRRYNRVPTPYNGPKNRVTELAEPVARRGRPRRRKEPMETRTTDTSGPSRLPVREVLSGEFVRSSDY